jgi:hypothetical protein
VSESKGVQKLIDFWKDFDANSTRDQYIHEQDKLLPSSRNSESRSSMETFFANIVSVEANQGFHCSLRPVPYLGNLKKADMFILLLNPVVGYSDYGTDARAEFRDALVQNIHQNFEGDGGRCLALDPQFWWSSWFSWYEKMLRTTISKYAEDAKKTYLDALDDLSRRLAIIELVPYYSLNSDKVNVRLVEELKSAQAAKEAAQELVHRAAYGEALVVVRWGRRLWEIEPGENVVCNDARGWLEKTQSRMVNHWQSRPTNLANDHHKGSPSFNLL